MVLVRWSLANMEEVSDRSGEENDPTDIIGIITSCGIKGVTVCVVQVVHQAINAVENMWLPN